MRKMSYCGCGFLTASVKNRNVVKCSWRLRIRRAVYRQGDSFRA